jgi:hypothetical protein
MTADEHRREAERLLTLIDVSNLAPGDLTSVVLAHALLCLPGVIRDAAEQVAEAIPLPS